MPLFSRYMDLKRELDQLAITSAFNARQLVSDSEWQNILDDAVAGYEKNNKKREKHIAQLKKSVSKVHNRVEIVIKDDKRRSQAKQIIDNFEKSIVEIQKNYNQINYRDN